MNVRYRIELSQTERAELTAILSGGTHAARRLKRAPILLAVKSANGCFASAFITILGCVSARTLLFVAPGNDRTRPKAS